MDETPLLPVLLIVTLTASFAAQGAIAYQVFPQNPQVMEGEGLVLAVTPTDVGLTSCVVTFAGHTLNFTQTNTSDTTVGVSYWGSGLAKGECGVRILVYNSSQHGSSGSSFYFRLQTLEPQTVALTSKVTVLDPVESGWEESIVTSLGHPAVIDCSRAGSVFCRVVSPLNAEVVYEPPCVVNVSSVRMQDAGTWSCYNSLLGRATEVLTLTNITVNSVKTMDIGLQEEDAYVNLFCNSLIQDQTVRFCRFERPDGEVFNLQDGASSTRYTYYGGGLAQRMCGVSIQTPLTAEDLGVWTCSLGMTDGTKTGGFITVNASLGAYTAAPHVEPHGPERVMVRNGSALIIQCSTHAALRYCWLRHPDGTRYTVHPSLTAENYQYYGDGLELGQCGLQLAVATVADSGTWVCAMGIDGQSDVSPDIQVPVDVTVSESPFVANDAVVAVIRGDVATLGCRSIHGEALQYCSFEAPNGTAYSLNSAKSTSTDRYTYFGNGLEQGDCGIRIKVVAQEDYGNWKCAAMLVTSQAEEEHYQVIILTEPGISTSSTIGITLGVAAAALLGVFYLVVSHQRKRRRANIPEECQPASLDPPQFSVLASLSDTSEEVDMSGVASSGEWKDKES